MGYQEKFILSNMPKEPPLDENGNCEVPFDSIGKRCNIKVKDRTNGYARSNWHRYEIYS